MRLAASASSPRAASSDAPIQRQQRSARSPAGSRGARLQLLDRTIASPSKGLDPQTPQAVDVSHGAERAPPGPRPACGRRCPWSTSPAASRLVSSQSRAVRSESISMPRGARSTSMPLPRQLVEPRALVLERRIHRGDLLVPADETQSMRSAAPHASSCGTGCLLDDLAFRVAGGRSGHRDAAETDSTCVRVEHRPAILVASPRQIGNMPLASGSRLPVCPALRAGNRFTRCRAAFELSPAACRAARCRQCDAGAATDRLSLRRRSRSANGRIVLRVPALILRDPPNRSVRSRARLPRRELLVRAETQLRRNAAA